MTTATDNIGFNDNGSVAAMHPQQAQQQQKLQHRPNDTCQIYHTRTAISVLGDKKRCSRSTKTGDKVSSAWSWSNGRSTRDRTQRQMRHMWFRQCPRIVNVSVTGAHTCPSGHISAKEANANLIGLMVKCKHFRSAPYEDECRAMQLNGLIYICAMTSHGWMSKCEKTNRWFHISFVLFGYVEVLF